MCLKMVLSEVQGAEGIYLISHQLRMSPRKVYFFLLLVVFQGNIWDRKAEPLPLSLEVG